MVSTRSRAEWLSGTCALVWSRRRFLVGVPGLGVLLPGLVAGLWIAVVQEPPNRELGKGVACWLATGLFLIPLGLGGLWTFGPAAAGLPGRRQELLGLPLGRLAIPAAVLLASAIGVALGALAAYLVSVATGDMLLRSLELLARHEGGASAIDIALGALACVGLGFAIGTVGSSTAHGPLVLVFPAAAACVVATTIGHTASVARLNAELWLGAFAVYAFAVPFVLYGRVPHHWAHQRFPCADRADLRATAAGMMSLLALVFAGGAWAACVLALGVGFAVLAVRREPRTERRRPWPHVRVAHTLALALFVPLAVAALVADARLVASVGPRNPAVGAALCALAPDARRVAVALRLPGSSLRRVAVLDVEGEAPPLELPARFAAVGGWSADGRYLAAHDQTLGRLPMPFADLAYSLDDAFSWLFRIYDAAGETLVLDTHASGAIAARRPPLLVAEGWMTPAELLHVVRRSRDGFVLVDGVGVRYALQRRGGRMVVPRASGGELELELFHLARYERGRPVLFHDGQSWWWGPTGLEPVADPYGWRIVHDEEDGTSSGVTLARGDERLVLSGAKSVHVLSPSAALVAEAGGLYRVQLPGLGRQLLVACRDGEVVDVRQSERSFAVALDAHADARVVSVGGALYLVSREGPATPLVYATCAFRQQLVRWTTPPVIIGTDVDGRPVAERLAPELYPDPLGLLPDGSVLVRDAKLRLSLVRPDGQRRRVLGE